MVRRRSGGAIFGHNNDHRPYAVLVLRHFPVGGYASISVVNVPSMNDVAANPGLARFQGQASLLRAPFYPQEGMNERGVAIAGMGSPGQERLIDPRRATLSYEQAMRLVLDHAADLDEALLLLGGYNLASSHSQHLLVADAFGAFGGCRVLRRPHGGNSRRRRLAGGDELPAVRAHFGAATFRVLALDEAWRRFEKPARRLHAGCRPWMC